MTKTLFSRARQLLALVVLPVLVLLNVRSAESQATPVEVPAVLSLSGAFAFVGHDQENMLKLIEKLTNDRGGIQGHPLKFVVSDDQSNVANGVQLASGLIQRGAPLALGFSISQICSAVIPLLKDGPTTQCFSPAIHPTRGSYAFSVSVTSYEYTKALVRYARDRGWKKIAMITSTDASGQDSERAFLEVLALPENASLHLLAQEHFNATDLSVSAQMARIKATAPDLVIAWTSGAAFGTLLHGLRDTGITAPLYISTAATGKAQLLSYGDLVPNNMYFPAPRAFDPEDPAQGAIREAQQVFKNSWKQFGSPASGANTFVWDNVMIMVDALKKLGPNATATQIRDYVEHLRAWTGIEGVYNFTDPHDTEHRGIGVQSIKIYRWDTKTQESVAVSRPAGIEIR